MFAEVRFVQPLVVDGIFRQAGEVVRLDYLLATALVRNGAAVPLGAELQLERRPIRGRFVPMRRPQWP